jgi:hypothetical protein
MLRPRNAALPLTLAIKRKVVIAFPSLTLIQDIYVIVNHLTISKRCDHDRQWDWLPTVWS